MWNFNDEVVKIWKMNKKDGEGSKSGVMMWNGGGEKV
jgi:hypothetical protein